MIAIFTYLIEQITFCATHFCEHAKKSSFYPSIGVQVTKSGNKMQKVKGPVPDRGSERGWGTEGPLTLLNVVLLDKLTDLYFFLSF